MINTRTILTSFAVKDQNSLSLCSIDSMQHGMCKRGKKMGTAENASCQNITTNMLSITWLSSDQALCLCVHNHLKEMKIRFVSLSFKTNRWILRQGRLNLNIRVSH